MKLARVFPRRVDNATPTDQHAYIGDQRLLARMEGYDAVHVSVTFTWDIAEGERLEKLWKSVAPVTIGGPAFDDPGGEFVPGRYLQPGYTITSRGCPNNCWYCDAWKREGQAVRELKIFDGFNVLDNNLLACSREHQEAVFAMLARQPQKPRFTGGLDARLFGPWHAAMIKRLKPEIYYFACDRPGDLDHLSRVSRLLREAKVPMAGHRARCYVLCGYKRDTRPEAEARLRAVAGFGLMPFAMFYDGGDWMQPAERRAWKDMLAPWITPKLVAAKMKECQCS